jgi:hypothetical protein
MNDSGFSSEDVVLRTAFGKFNKPLRSDVIGLCGSPVFNLSQKSLCGIVVRGGMNNDDCTLRYIDFFDVFKVLDAVHRKQSLAIYRKRIISEIM